MSARLTAFRASMALAFLLSGCRSEQPQEPATPVSTPALPPLPAEWAGRTNPRPNDAETITRGRAVFLLNCAPCHGPEADGKGVASTGLVPPPANFRDGKRLSLKGDDFLFWRISTGITGTAMPAFGGTLS